MSDQKVTGNFPTIAVGSLSPPADRITRPAPRLGRRGAF